MPPWSVAAAEYTTMGTLFQYFVGSLPWPIIITVGILTMGYTMYGGLYISIITDQIQVKSFQASLDPSDFHPPMPAPFRKIYSE